MGPPLEPPALPGTVLAWRHWWLGCSPCQYKTKISQWEKKTNKNSWTRLPRRELVSLNDWRMLAQINSSWHFRNTLKSFRGLQFKDLKHLTDTYVTRWREEETPLSSVENECKPTWVARWSLSYTKHRKIQCNENKWCVTLSGYVCVSFAASCAIHLLIYYYLTNAMFKYLKNTL